MKKGFTLVELAIVLVIIGLLVGGVLQGQELIRVSKYQNIMNGVENLKRAYLTFYSKYDCLPGDCVNIAKFLPTQTNGNGDKNIENQNDGSNTYFEPYMAFEHMTAAGVYQYGSGNPNCFVDPNLNSPNFSNRPLFYQDCNYPLMPFNSPMTIGYYQYVFYGLVKANTMMFCVNSDNCDDPIAESTLSGEEARNIDTKYDDGKPFKGKVLGACTASAPYYFDEYLDAIADEDYDPTVATCAMIMD